MEAVRCLIHIVTEGAARFLNPTTQNYLRQQAIQLREQGKRFVDIAAYLGLILAAEKFWSFVKRQRQLSHFRCPADQTLEA